MSNNKNSAALTGFDSYSIATSNISSPTDSLSGIGSPSLFNSNPENSTLTNDELSPASAIEEVSFRPYMLSQIASSLAAQSLMVKGSLESVQSNSNYIFGNDRIETLNETSSAFTNGILQDWEIKALKQGFLMQLTNHPLKPIAYDEGAGANVVEFHKHKSHFVYIADEDGVQLMWTKDSKPYSSYIPNNALSLIKISNNVAQLMLTPE